VVLVLLVMRTLAMLGQVAGIGRPGGEALRKRPPTVVVNAASMGFFRPRDRQEDAAGAVVYL
jgi:hypothetical protein